MMLILARQEETKQRTALIMIDTVRSGQLMPSLCRGVLSLRVPLILRVSPLSHRLPATLSPLALDWTGWETTTGTRDLTRFVVTITCQSGSAQLLVLGPRHFPPTDNQYIDNMYIDIIYY